MTNVKDENIEKLVLLDATPFSLGIETTGGVITILIPRNSLLPTKKSETFSTDNDGQSSFLVKIYEGEEPLTKNNHLGKFLLDGIPPMPRGQPQIEITIDIDVNSILNVTAEEKSTGKNNKIVITNDQSRLSKDDIDRCVKEAEKSKEENDKERDRIEAKNNFEKYVYLVRQTIKEERLKDKFDEEEKKQIENKIDEVLNFVNDNPDASKEEYDEKEKEIEAVFNPIIRKIYQKFGKTVCIPNFGYYNGSKE